MNLALSLALGAVRAVISALVERFDSAVTRFDSTTNTFDEG